MIAYKCCKWHEGRLVSWSYWFMGEETMAHYAVDETTHRKPLNGPLATFRTLEEALKFRRLMDGNSSDAPIYECEVEPSDAGRLWYTNACGIREYTDPTAPTLFADSVKLLRKVA